MSLGEYKYMDIITCDRPVHDGDLFSVMHPKMDREKRAKIFAPFAALKGYEEAIDAKTFINSNK